MNRLAMMPLLTMVAATLGMSCARASGADGQAAIPPPKIIQLLSEGQAVFGIFSGEHTAEQGAIMAENHETDFVFYSLESGPFDIPQMQTYAQAMADAAGERTPHPMALRIPPIRDGESAARDRVKEALAAGVAAIVFPHVESSAQAAVAVSAMGADVWPLNGAGRLINMLIVEDRVGVENVRAIVGTEGVSVVFAGPGDLRRAYDRDMEAVENAIQTVLSACREFDVPCGITAGGDDIATRLEQGFRVIIVTQPDALAVGRRAAGRPD